MKTIVLLAAVALFLLSTACQSEQSVSKEIEEHLHAIVKNEKAIVSSNPNVYIQQNQKHYQEIIDKGNDALSYLVNELKSSKQNGLKEWIMAKASEDILKDKSPVKEWSTGKEWITKYKQSN